MKHMYRVTMFKAHESFNGYELSDGKDIFLVEDTSSPSKAIKKAEKMWSQKFKGTPYFYDSSKTTVEYVKLP